jgi:arsenite-transporting ATPase
MSVRQRQALAGMPQGLRPLVRTEVPLLAFNVTGLSAIRAVGHPARSTAAEVKPTEAQPSAEWPTLSALVRDIEASGRGVILAMGKGGVGKTTIASALAVELAARGHRVHLTTTDPAAHIEHAVGASVPNLQTSRIDPRVEVAAYSREVMESAGADLDEEGRKLLEEDLRSPCTEEIAVFRAFAARVDEGRDGFVVLDTAPTGHTLLLLDATEAYHREVSRTQSDLPEAIRQLLPRLRDPVFSKVILVTLPEATPVHEAAQLQEDLQRAGICPFAWVINQSLSPLTLSHPLLQARRAREQRFIAEVRQHTARLAVVPWLAQEPTGIEGLRQLTRDPRESNPPERKKRERPCTKI